MNTKKLLIATVIIVVSAAGVVFAYFSVKQPKKDLNREINKPITELADNKTEAPADQQQSEAAKTETTEISTQSPSEAYMQYSNALSAGNIEAARNYIASQQIQQVEQDGGKVDDVLGMFSKNWMKNVTVVGEKIEGGKATITVTGEWNSKVQKGTIEMINENGGWKVAHESWTSNL